MKKNYQILLSLSGLFKITYKEPSKNPHLFLTSTIKMQMYLIMICGLGLRMLAIQFI